MIEKDIEENLIVEIQSGNKRAEEDLYLIYKNKINRLLRKKFPKNSEHEDDVSEILIKVFESIKIYDSSKSKFHSWVINIMKNYMIDKSRKKKPIYMNFTSYTSNSNSLDYSNSDIQGSTTLFSCNGTSFTEPQSFLNSPLDDLEINDSLNFLSNKIGVQDFSMLSLKYKDGYDYKEIGEEYKLKDSQISNKINYSRSKLKKKKKDG